MLARHVKITGLVLGLFLGVAGAEDRGFRYDPNLLVCKSDVWRSGFYNPEFFGECGDHRGAIYFGFPFENKKLSGSNFSDADLTESIFHSAELRSVLFQNSNLRSVDFAFANLELADFRGANAEGANLFWANLQSAKLHGADLSYADLRGAEMNLIFFDSRTQFMHAIFDEDTKLPFSFAVARQLGMRFIPARSED